MAVFLDTETTGLSPARGDAIVEIAIVDAAGRTLIDTLVDPQRPIPWHATNVHGITDDMVRGKPTLRQILPRVASVIAHEEVVIYNARFDAPFFPGQLKKSRGVCCAMTDFASALGGPRRKLEFAAKHVGHRWTGEAHRALADALACRSVWLWLQVRRWNVE
jgi:DNA polymerase III epsilon subunit-like protein